MLNITIKNNRMDWECSTYERVAYRFLVETPEGNRPLGRPKRKWEDSTRVGTLIVATIYLQLIQNRYMFRSFTVLQCSHQHCVQPVASDVEVVGYH